MRRWLVAVALLAGLSPVAARADGEDQARAGRDSVLVGEQFVLVVEVHTDPGATVEIDPLAPTWAGIEVIRIVSQASRADGTGETHRIECVVAGFLPGVREFQPGVLVTRDGVPAPRAVPAVPVVVRSSLPADAPLELSPLPDAERISGAESPLLRPAIWGAAAVGAALLLLGALGAGRLVAQRLRRRGPAPQEPGPPPVSLEEAERLLGVDPVLAYRSIGALVRAVVAERYAIPALALTTRELRIRMDAEGTDRWAARLVSGLLQECDAVVYAGYQPASERSRADLTMAREILEGA